MLFTLFLAEVAAQLPQVSTASQPEWYYIQVQGESDGRTDRVFTVEGTSVFGRTMVVEPASPDLDKQLWRFEQSGSNYLIFNKANEKKLGITYNASKDISVGNLSDSPATQWQLEKNGDYYNIKATVVPSGGDALKVYAHQANNYGNRNFVIMFEESNYNNTANSKFHFVSSKDYSIALSTDEKPVWYFITSAQPEHLNKGITDIVDQAHPHIKFAIETIDVNNDSQQWKVVKKSNAITDERVQFINRATGHIIQTASILNNSFHYIQYTDQTDGSNGWNTNHIGSGQFEVYATENDGIVRYLNLAAQSQQQPDFLGEDTKDTGFAWLFTTVGDNTGLKAQTSDQPHIYVKDKRIVVAGSDDYVIRNIQGISVAQSVDLSAGVYLVTVREKIYKIIVKR
jgi:hypothetical protein